MLLAGDIGGTKTALAVFSEEHGPRAPIAEKVFPSGDYPSLEAIAREYIAEVDLPVTHACFAVAGPVSGGRAALDQPALGHRGVGAGGSARARVREPAERRGGDGRGRATSATRASCAPCRSAARSRAVPSPSSPPAPGSGRRS